jgi:hypothetical protein
MIFKQKDFKTVERTLMYYSLTKSFLYVGAFLKPLFFVSLAIKNRVMAEKYINLFTNFGFKKIFGEEANKDLLIDFLNELLKLGIKYLKNYIIFGCVSPISYEKKLLVGYLFNFGVGRYFVGICATHCPKS